MRRYYCKCGCMERVPPGRRLYFSDKCAGRVSKQASRARDYDGKERARKRKKRRAVLGRKCLGCKSTDAQKNWSDGKLCKACKSLQDEHGLHECGAPFWNGSPGQPLRCRAGCAA